MTNANHTQLCDEVGLDCTQCVRECAGHTARICGSLNGRLIGEIFGQIYHHAQCQQMSDLFARAYVEALVPRRKPVASAA